MAGKSISARTPAARMKGRVSKLRAHEEAEAVQLLLAGQSSSMVGARFGINKATVCAIAARHGLVFVKGGAGYGHFERAQIPTLKVAGPNYRAMASHARWGAKLGAWG